MEQAQVVVQQNKAKKTTPALIKNFCDKVVAKHVPEGTQRLSRGLFHYQLTAHFGISVSTIRKWKQLGDKRYLPIDSVYEFINSKLEDYILNGSDPEKAKQALNYWKTINASALAPDNDNKAEDSNKIIIEVKGESIFKTTNEPNPEQN